MKTSQKKKPGPTKQAITSYELIMGLALACNISWVSMNFKSLNMLANHNHMENLLDTVYLISIIVLVITLTLVGYKDQQAGRLLSKNSAKVAIPLFVSISTLILPLSGLEGIFGNAILILSGLLSGIFSALLLIYFGTASSRLSTRSAVVSAAIGFVLAMLLFSLFLLFSPLESCIFAASMPIAGSVLLYFAMKEVEESNGTSVVPLSEQLPIKDQADQTEYFHLLWSLALCSAMIGFSNEALRTIYMQMGLSDVGGQAYAFIQALIAFVVTGGAVLISLALLSVKEANHFKMPKYCYRVLFAFLVLGALLLPATLIYEQMGVNIPYSINSASYQCFSLFIWIITAGICHRYSTRRVRFFALIRAAWALGPLAGMLIGRYVVYSVGISISSVFPVMLICVIVIILTSNVAFTENDLLTAINAMPLERKRRFIEKCQKVIAKYGLTEREGEIMIMFAKGRNVAYIQDQLCLSRSTISTHRQHIYQKINIHSLQELLDAIDEQSL